jgi:hypothetical protein
MSVRGLGHGSRLPEGKRWRSALRQGRQDRPEINFAKLDVAELMKGGCWCALARFIAVKIEIVAVKSDS